MKGINLSFLRTCIAVADERPRIQLTQTFSALFSALGLSSNAVSTSFGCRVNIAICMQVKYSLVCIYLFDLNRLHFSLLILLHEFIYFVLILNSFETRLPHQPRVAFFQGAMVKMNDNNTR